jgi:hypothetical protein
MKKATIVAKRKKTAAKLVFAVRDGKRAPGFLAGEGALRKMSCRQRCPVKSGENWGSEQLSVIG